MVAATITLATALAASHLVDVRSSTNCPSSQSIAERLRPLLPDGPAHAAAADTATVEAIGTRGADTELNTVVPHSAFAGQTPDEMYFGRGDQVPADLAAGRARAREPRMRSNRALSCEACRPAIQETPSTSDFSAISGVLQMHEEISAMS